MRVIELYGNIDMLESRIYEINNNRVQKIKKTIEAFEIIDILQRNPRLITSVSFVNDDMNFQYKDSIVIIRNYNKLKYKYYLQNLRQILNHIYKKEKLRKKRIIKMGSSISIVSMAALVLLSLSSTDKNEDIYVQLPMPESLSVDEMGDGLTDFDDVYEEKEIKFDEEKVYTSDFISDDVLEKPIVDDVVVDDMQVFDSVSIFYEDRSQNQKIIDTRKNYGDVITKYANMYGLDPNLMIAVATQEKGFHSVEVDPGGAIGIMQIQYNFWVGKELTVFNYQTNSYETISVDDSNIRDLETNIRLGCAIMRANLDMMKNNQFAALQSYNYGSGNTFKVLDAYAYERALTRDDVLLNYNDVGWVTDDNNLYRCVVDCGDKNYIEHVLSYLGPDVSLTYMTDNGLVNINIKNDYEIVRS